MTLRDFRERVNLSLYESKAKNLKIFKILKLFISLIALVVLSFYFGYPQTPDSSSSLLGFVKFSFVFYVLHYLIRIIYDFHPLQFLKEHWFEGIVMSLLVIEGVSDLFFDSLLLEPMLIAMGIDSYTDFSTIFIQLYFVIVIITELMRKGNVLPSIEDVRFSMI